MIDDPFDRGVDAEELAAEIHALRTAADGYATATRDIAALGLELEHAAVRYAEKRDERIRAAVQVNYVAIVRVAERDREASEN